MFRSKLLKILLSVLVFALLFTQIEPEQFLVALKSLSLGAIALLMLISFILIYLSSLKWSYFLHAFGSEVSVLRLFALYHLGYFFNLIAPSYIGGDAARSYYVGKEMGQHKAAAATILERYTGLVAMISLGFMFVWFVDLATPSMKAAIVLLTLGLAALSLVALSQRILSFIRRLPFGDKVVPHLEKIQEGFKIAKSNPKLILNSFALSYLYHTVTLFNVAVTAYVVGWINPPLLDLFVVLPLVLLISALPLTPNSLGIQEGAYFYFLSGLGATGSQALAIALILRAKQYVLAVIGWFVFLAEGSRPKAPTITSPLN